MQFESTYAAIRYACKEVDSYLNPQSEMKNRVCEQQRKFA